MMTTELKTWKPKPIGLPPMVLKPLFGQPKLDAPDAAMIERAKRAWPDRPEYQAKWLRSIRLLRAGRGWVLESSNHNFLCKVDT